MKKYFITGLIILLPLVVTLAIIVFVVNFFTAPFIDLVSPLLCHLPIFAQGFLFLSAGQLIRYTAQVLILAALFLFTVGLGLITRLFLTDVILKLCDRILTHIPLVNTVYTTTQDIIKTLFGPDKKAFRQVVMVPFPRPGIYVIGFISRESPPVCCEAAEKELISVLVPATPNPTTGFLMMFKEEDILRIDMKPQEALKYIVSCGVILPESSTPIKQ